MVEILFRKRTAILLAALFFVVLSSGGMFKVKFTSDTRVFFSNTDPRYSDLKDFEATFLPNHNILFIIQSPDPFYESADTRSALRWVTDEVPKIDNVLRVDSLATLTYTNGYQQEAISATSFLDYVCPSDCSLNRTEVLDSNLVAGRLVGSSHNILGVVATLRLDRQEADKIASITSQTRILKTEFETLFPRHSMYITGGIPMSQAFVDAGERDVTTLFGACLALLFVCLWSFLGTLRNVAILSGIALASVTTTLGLAGWFGTTLNSATASTPVVIFTLVVATGIHLFAHYLRLCSDDRGPAFAASSSLRINAIPIAITVGTSFVSLGSLVFVDSPAIQKVGILSAAGVLIGGLFTLTVAPLLLNTTCGAQDSRVNSWLQHHMNRFAQRIRESSAILVCGLAICAFAALGLFRLNIDDDFVAYFGDRLPFRTDTEFAIDNLSGPNHIEVRVRSRSNSIFDPNAINQLRELSSEIRRYEIVSSVVSLVDVLELAQSAFLRDGASLPDSEEAIAQSFFLYEMSLGAGESTGDIVTPDHGETRISVLLRRGTARQIRHLEAAIQGAASDLGLLEVVVTGENIPVAHLSSRSIPATARSIVLSLLVTGLVFSMGFGWKNGLNALGAMVIPVVGGFGIWGWIQGSIGIAATVVVAASIGVVIDDVVHLIYQQRHASRMPSTNRWESVAYSIHRAGVPIVATTTIMIIGVSPLFLSDFTLNSTFAICIAIIFALAVVYDMSVLPRAMARLNAD